MDDAATRLRPPPAVLTSNFKHHTTALTPPPTSQLNYVQTRHQPTTFCRQSSVSHSHPADCPLRLTQTLLGTNLGAADVSFSRPHKHTCAHSGLFCRCQKEADRMRRGLTGLFSCCCLLVLIQYLAQAGKQLYIPSTVCEVRARECL